MSELTALLHLAYGQLAAMGFRFHASYQTEEVTRKRAAKGECYVGLKDKRLVATVTLTDPDKSGGSPWYEQPGVANVNQFAVIPELQKNGIGSGMMDFVEMRAAQKDYSELALDTSEGATHLIKFYQKRGYRFIESVRWDTTNFRSKVFSKTLK